MSSSHPLVSLVALNLYGDMRAPAYPMPVTRRPVASQTGQLARRNYLSGASLRQTCRERVRPADSVRTNTGLLTQVYDCPRRTDPYRIEGSGGDGGRVSGGSHVAVDMPGNQRNEWVRARHASSITPPPPPPAPDPRHCHSHRPMDAAGSPGWRSIGIAVAGRWLKASRSVPPTSRPGGRGHAGEAAFPSPSRGCVERARPWRRVPGQSARLPREPLPVATCSAGAPARARRVCRA